MSCTKAKRTGRKKREERRGWKRAANMPIAEQSNPVGDFVIAIVVGSGGKRLF